MRGEREGEGERERERERSSSILQVANSGDDVLIFYNDHAFSTLLKLMKEDRDDAVSLTGQLKKKNYMYPCTSRFTEVLQYCFQ